MNQDELEKLLQELSMVSGEAERLISLFRRLLEELNKPGAGLAGTPAIKMAYEKAIQALLDVLTANEGYRDMLRAFFDMDAGISECFVCESPALAPDPQKPEAERTAEGQETEPVTLQKTEFSAIAPKAIEKGDYSIIDVIMYEESCRHIVDEMMHSRDEPAQEARSGVQQAAIGSRIRIELSSPDLEIEDNTETGIWQGGHLDFSFALFVPEDYPKKQILLSASVYIDDVIASKLKLVVKCTSSAQQEISVTREDILTAFISYASQDRERVSAIIQGMRKVRPDLDVFFDVESLRSGDKWEKEIYQEIDRRDVLFLCWSRNAEKSEWVDAEWRYALNKKGEDSIEPVPIEPPEICPPPKELQHKHFNDKLLYYGAKL